MCIKNASLGIKKLLFGLFHTLHAMSPAAPLPPPTPVTGEVVNSREVWNRRRGALLMPLSTSDEEKTHHRYVSPAEQEKYSGEGETNGVGARQADNTSFCG